MASLSNIIGSALTRKLRGLEYDSQTRLHNIGVMCHQHDLKYVDHEFEKVNKLKIEYMNIIDEIHEKVKNRPEFIPQNTCYCYTGFNSTYKCCPYWVKTPFEGMQNDGGCLYLKEFDNNMSLGLLWDQIKACGISDEIEYRNEE